MKANDITLSGILNTGNQYVIPVFQRYYVWGKDEWESLWNDIVEIYEDNNTQRKHFMGSIVVMYGEYASDKGFHTFQVIDGQQRTITMSLLLSVLRNLAVEYELNMMVAEIESYYLFHNPNTENEILRVYPRQRDRDVFIDAMKGVNSSTSRNSKINQLCEFFTRNIRNLIVKPEKAGEVLQRLFLLLKVQLEFVWIELKGENPYRIFKSLNSTGVDLEEGDLIRNFVFMHVPIAKQDDFDSMNWMRLEERFLDEDGKLMGRLFSDFFRDFLMRHGNYVTLNSVFSTFEATYESNLQPQELTEELVTTAVWYDYIRGVNEYHDEDINKALAKIRGLDTSTVYPLLLHLMELLENNSITKSSFIQALEMLASFILRRYITGENSRQYGRWFVAASLELLDSANILSSLRTFLLSKGFPNDEVFKSALIHFPIYNRNYTYYMYRELEYYHPHKERADMSGVSIEHIMPQTLTPEWKNYLGDNHESIQSQWGDTIGNLTLSAYNPEMSNRLFAYKKAKFYINSNIVLTRQLSEYDDWKEDQIKDRATKLARIACEIWTSI